MSKPKVKAIFPIYRLGSSLIVDHHSHLVEIPDTAGDIEYLFQLMDGTRTIVQIFDEMHVKF